MGGELGTLVATLLEDEPWVGDLVGIDADPPRHRLKRTTFHRIRPGEHDRAVQTILDFDPHVVVYMGVWEPDARAAPKPAAALTDESVTTVLGAAAECPSLESIVVRSGIEVYGRTKRSPTRPIESSRRRPTSGWGRIVENIERTALRVGERVGITVGTLRLAPVLGRHVPSPLGRLLRQPVVPFSLLADPPFAVIEDRDAARAFVAAAEQRLSGPLNVVAPGAITVRQAAHRGHRMTVPLIGPEWHIARPASHMLGAPIPDHVHELLHRGRLADGSAIESVLGIAPESSTVDVIDSLYSWPSVIHRPARRQVA